MKAKTTYPSLLLMLLVSCNNKTNGNFNIKPLVGTWEATIKGELSDIAKFISIAPDNSNYVTVEIIASFMTITVNDSTAGWYEFDEDGIVATYNPLEQHLSYTPEFTRKYNYTVEGNTIVFSKCTVDRCTDISSPFSLTLKPQ